MRVLVLGGRGFIGSNVVSALIAQGNEVLVGSRSAAVNGNTIQIKMHEITTLAQCLHCLEGIDAVVNCVGILRERLRESYAQIHTSPSVFGRRLCYKQCAFYPYVGPRLERKC